LFVQESFSDELAMFNEALARSIANNAALNSAVGLMMFLQNAMKSVPECKHVFSDEELVKDFVQTNQRLLE
jgi:hypothetical protein